MSSYRPRSYPRPLRRKKSRWILRISLLLIFFVVCWFAAPYLWNKAKEKFEPRVITVASNEEAVKRLNEILSAWDLNDEDLKRFGDRWESEFDWMSNESSKEAAKTMLALEYDLRGMWDESHPMFIDVFKNRISRMGEMTSEKQNAIFRVVGTFVNKLESRNDYAAAEQICDYALNFQPMSEEYVRLLIKGVSIKHKQGNISGAIELCSKMHAPEIQQLITSPRLIQEAAGLLLLEDEVVAAKNGAPSDEGMKIAEALLKKGKLDNVPEMGKIILIKNRKDIENIGNLSPEKNVHLEDELNKVLICFRADRNSAEYTPEVMLVMAKLFAAQDDINRTLLWLSRSEGAAMALGVDTPRIIKVKSLKDELARLRDECRDKLKYQALLETFEAKVSKTSGALTGKNWQTAREESLKNIEEAKDTKPADGYLILFSYQLAQAYAGESNWQSAATTYAGVLELWSQLTEPQQSALIKYSEKFGYKDLFKTAHRQLAEAYLKQNMREKAAATLKEIGEELPAETTTRRNSSRRSR